MGKGRAPCCDKSKVKRGPWSPAEDLRLITFIQKHGHDNWRALPKQAGLLRCGKSCRLRWINYLRPDVKRGNFTKEEEESIIKLHQALGNKWSKIASHLPGRTDNEIKNVWNTHLKKRSASNVKIKSQGHHSPTYCSPSSSSSEVVSLCDDKINDSQIVDQDQEEHLADKSSISQDCQIETLVLGSENGEGNVQEQKMSDGWDFGSNESFRISVSQELNLNSCQDDHTRTMTTAAAAITTTPTTTITDEQIGSNLDFTALWEEVNKPFESEDFPIGLQDDIDIDWNMLWNMEDLSQSNAPCHGSMTNNILINNNNNKDTIGQCEFGGNGTEVDNNKWLSYLENELGLID